MNRNSSGPVIRQLGLPPSWSSSSLVCALAADVIPPCTRRAAVARRRVGDAPRERRERVHLGARGADSVENASRECPYRWTAEVIAQAVETREPGGQFHDGVAG